MEPEAHSAATSFSIQRANNGYIVDRSTWKNSDYQDNKTLCLSWEDVLEDLSKNVL